MHLDATDIARMKSELQKDMEALERVERMMGQTTTSTMPVVADQPPVHETKSHPVDYGLNVGFSRPDNMLEPISLVAAVTKVINDDPGHRWTTQGVFGKLKSMGYPFGAKEPIFSIGQTLRKLVDRGEIRLARKGAGSEPNIYKGKTEQLKLDQPKEEGQQLQ